jgi:small conductance mechanosensitive channel
MHETLSNFTKFDYLSTQYLFPLAWKVIGAFAIWFAGGFAVRGFQKLLTKGLTRRNVDPTLIHYANSTLGLLLKGLLVLAVLGVFGVETTSFSAILAAAGVAIGVAWSGLLANFAAGIFLIILRPFKVGDTIFAAGVTGTVRQIGLFATTIDNGDNLRLFVPNNKLFSDNILNYSANAYRVALFRVQLAREVDPNLAIGLLTAELKKILGVLPLPAVSGEITEFNSLGVIVTMRAPCHHGDYANVTSAAYQVIHRVIKAANFPAPEARTILVQTTST